ncbi:hypothetical protein K466DRAFT_61780 [Polyporus arcularius HHB13444]|uniref:Uncharacterized protein n=1 Tax=Polyporus arcularius HHB13444 TaxID=1314778 RepID=A0A5C3NMI1_9APHY|nr:hypothetical protein K466DRAFT_61780 [Polyporus arcularius HHB13444]
MRLLVLPDRISQRLDTNRILFLLNVLNLVFTLLSEVVVNESGLTYLTVFTNPLMSVLVSRFLLQLQETSQTTLRVGADDPLHLSIDPYNDMPSFVRSMGSVILPVLPYDNNHDPDSDSCACVQ